MSSARVAAVLGCAVLGVAAAWWIAGADGTSAGGRSGPAVGVEPQPVPGLSPVPSPSHEHVDHGQGVGPNGLPIEAVPGRALKTEGLPPRPAPSGPVDGQTWDARTREAGSRWARASVDEVERFSIEEDLDPDTRVAVLQAITEFTGEVERIRDGIRSGDLEPGSGRREVMAARNRVATRMGEALGEDAERLRARLADARVGGGW